MVDKQPPGYVLVIERPERPAERIPMTAKKLKLGRAAGDIVLGDPHASSVHGELSFSSGVLTYLDLGSSNGSYDGNGEMIVGPKYLRAGSVVKIGATIIRVEALEPEAPKPRTIAATQALSAEDLKERVAALRAEDANVGSRDPSPAAGPGGALFDALAADASAFLPREGLVIGDLVTALKGAPAMIIAGIKEGIDLVLKHWKAVPKPTVAHCVETVKGVVTLIRPRWLDTFLVLGAITVPMAVLGWILAFIPVIGAIASLVLTLAGYVVSLLGSAAVAFSMLRLQIGRPVSWLTAWRAILPVAPVWIVSSIVCGLVAMLGIFGIIVGAIALGSFTGQAFFAEKKRWLATNQRSLELVRHDWLRLVVIQLLAALVIMVGGSVAATLLGVVPIVGPLLTSVLMAIVNALFVPFLNGIVNRFYFDIRKQVEGGDPLAAAREALRAA